jgi:hypothetical protein
LATCVITLPLVAKFGVIGAAWGGLFAVMAQVSMGIVFVSSFSGRPEGPRVVRR